jgi:hypothetical protein
MGSVLERPRRPASGLPPRDLRPSQPLPPVIPFRISTIAAHRAEQWQSRASSRTLSRRHDHMSHVARRNA